MSLCCTPTGVPTASPLDNPHAVKPTRPRPSGAFSTSGGCAAGAVVGEPARGRLVRGTDYTLICCGVPVANVWVELMLGRFLPHSQSSPGLGARAIQCPFEHHFCGIEVGRGWQI